MIKWNRIKSWLLPGVLIFGILGAVTIPATCFYTYSGRSEVPDHVLTYTPNQLTWDSSTGISADGIAQMDLFDTEYANVSSSDAENLIAPGTGKTNIVRLKNDANETIQYTAVLYYVTSDVQLPLNITLNESNAVSQSAVLPNGISADQIIATTEGSVAGNQIQDFDVTWNWDFYRDEQQDAVDTTFGNQENPDNVTVGLYIQVEDNTEQIIRPETPHTGDQSQLSSYIALMIVGTAVLALLLIEQKKDRKSR